MKLNGKLNVTPLLVMFLVVALVDEKDIEDVPEFVVIVDAKVKSPCTNGKMLVNAPENPVKFKSRQRIPALMVSVPARTNMSGALASGPPDEDVRTPVNVLVPVVAFAVMSIRLNPVNAAVVPRLRTVVAVPVTPILNVEKANVPV